MDLVAPLAVGHVTGRLEASVESALLAQPALVMAAARDLVMTNFPDTLALDVLTTVGLHPDAVLGVGEAWTQPTNVLAKRRRNPAWRHAVLEAWYRQCAFCGIRRTNPWRERRHMLQQNAGANGPAGTS
jgi:putative restriction endonuclease